MDKIKIILFFLIFSKLIIVSVHAQSPASNQSKYWFYRYRLTNEFLKKGEASCGSPSGFSIPASSAYKSDEDLHFGDGTSHLGFYIAVLAMEHKLLRTNGGTPEQKNRTAQELYFAMKAYERLDKNAEKLKTNLIGNNCENDLNGFFIRDDVKATPNKNEREQSDYLLDGKFKTPIRPFVPNLNEPNKIEYKVITSDFSDNLPNSNDPCKNGDDGGLRYPSQDQISDLFTGFSLVVKCMAGEGYNGYNFADNASFYADKIANHLQVHDYFMHVPNSDNYECVAKYGKMETRMNSYAIAKAADVVAKQHINQNKAVVIGWPGNDAYQNEITAIFKPSWENLWGYPNGNRMFDYNYSNQHYQINWGLPAPLDKTILEAEGNDYNNGLIAQFGAVGNSWKVGLSPFVALNQNIHIPWPCSSVNYSCREVCMCCRRWCDWRETICYPDGIQWWDCGWDIRVKVWCYNNPERFLGTFVGTLISQLSSELNIPLGQLAGDVISILTNIVPNINFCAPIELPELSYNITALTLSEMGKKYKFAPYALLHRELHNNGIYSYDQSQLEYYMNTAPCTGPHRKPYRDRHNPPLNNDWSQPSQSPGEYGWKVDNRWQKANSEYYEAKDDHEAWTGLDYMFLYNLYYLRHGGTPYRDKLDVQLTDQSFNSNKTYIGYESLLCSNSTVLPSGNVTFRAGNSIKLTNGFKASAGSTFKATSNPVFTCSEILDENTSARLEEETEPIPDTLVTQNVEQTIESELNSHVAEFKDIARTAVQNYKAYEPFDDYIARKENTASQRIAGIYLRLSPNPATQHLSLSVSGNLDENYTWSIENAMGITKLTGQTCCYSFYQNSETIDISSLFPGAYTLKLSSVGVSQSVHFIKQ